MNTKIESGERAPSEAEHPGYKKLYETAMMLLDMRDRNDKRLDALASPALQAEPGQWIDDPHDIEQGQMLNPEWLRWHSLTAKEGSRIYAPPALQAAAVPVEFQQFLTDVMTAAGLVRHGRQSMALAERLSDGCVKFRTEAPSAQAAAVPEAAEPSPALQAETQGVGDLSWLSTSQFTGDERIAYLAGYRDRGHLNARLIALAPEMLDELRRVRNYLSTEIAYTHSTDGDDFATHADYEASVVVRSIDNLIAQATGGQS